MADVFQRRENERQRRIAVRIAKAVPERPMALTGAPKEMLHIPFNTRDPKAVAVAIHALAQAVTASKPRRYFQPPLLDGHNLGIEYQHIVGPARVIRYWDPGANAMMSRADVWVG